MIIAAMRLIGKAPFVANLKIRELEDQIAQAGFMIIETHTFPGQAPSRFIVARKL